MFDIVISIVTHNSDINLLKNLILQIKNEKKLKLAVFILDNLSDRQYFDELLDLDCKVVSSGKNLGYGSGNNLINKITDKSKYFLVIDPDISLENNTILNCFDFLEKNKEYVAITPTLKLNNKLYFKNEKRNFSITEMFLRRFTSDKTLGNFSNYIIKNKVFECTHISGAFMFIRRENFSYLNGFDEKFFMYFEDIDLSLRLKKVGKIGKLDYVFAYHKRSRASYKDTKMFIIHLLSYFKFKFKNYKN